MIQILKQQLTDSIREAFAGSRYPGDGNLVSDPNNHLEKKQIKDYFKGKKWEEIILNSLRSEYIGDESVCLYFMTEESIRYYLPAYMLIAVDDFNDADMILDSVIAILTPKETSNSDQDRFYSWVNGLSSNQCKVISSFLFFMEQQHSDYFFDGEPGIALDAYWRKFL